MTKLPIKAEIKNIIGIELESMNLKLRAFANNTLIKPQETKLIWEYGNKEEFPAWIVGDLRERNVIIVYCPNGHGTYGKPWGINFSTSKHFGQDSGWYSSFESLLLDGWYE